MKKLALLAALTAFVAAPAFAEEKVEAAKEAVKTEATSAAPSAGAPSNDKKAMKIVKRDHKKEEVKKDDTKKEESETK